MIKSEQHVYMLSMHTQGELMVASQLFAASGAPPRISRMTLAFMEDSGWYVANYAVAGYMDWGAGDGCSLPQSTCSTFQANNPSQNLFCSTSESADLMRGSTGHIRDAGTLWYDCSKECVVNFSAV